MSSKYDHLIPSVKAALPDDLVVRFEDNDYQRALLSRKGDVPEATTLLQKYVHARLDYPKFYENMTVKNVELLLDHVLFCPVSGLKTKDGMTVMYYDASTWDPSILSLEGMWGATAMLSDLVSIIAPEFLDPGYITITNMHGFSVKQIRATNPRTYGRGAHFFYESMIGIEQKNYHINSSFVLEMGQKAVRAFNPKIMSELYIYIKKEKLTDILGENVVQNKKYIATKEDMQVYKKLIKDNLPIIVEKHQRMML